MYKKRGSGVRHCHERTCKVGNLMFLRRASMSDETLKPTHKTTSFWRERKLFSTWEKYPMS